MALPGLLEGLIQFAVVLSLSQGFCSHHVEQLTKRVRYPWDTRYPITFVILAVLFLPLIGGILNRIRGGWRPFGIITGDTAARLLFSSGTALYARGIGGVSTSLVVFVIVNTFLVGLGLLIGWGCYFSMGRPLDSPVPMPEGTHTDCIDEPDRYGCFDLIIGIAQLDWTSARRWRRDMAGMSLRGVLWMTPVGVGFHTAGYGSLLIRCGVLMGVVYELGYDTQPIDNPNFGIGTPTAEFYMGILWFLAVAVSVLAHRQEPYDDATPDDEDGAYIALPASSSKVEAKEDRPSLSYNMAMAQSFARVSYKFLDFVSWVWCLGTLVLIVYCAIENHPLYPPTKQ